MTTYLDPIVAHHRERASRDDRPLSALIKRAQRVEDPPSLLGALVRPDRASLRVIAEIKRRSPSRGELAPDLDVAALADAYARGGAAAISVLTDGPHFGGDPADVSIVREATSVAILRKDFTVCGHDVADARLMGASGVLLIAAVLTHRELRELMELASALGLTSLVEVHDEIERDMALDLGALVIGVNQRDLATFEIDHELAERLASGFPADVVTVAESGIADTEAARRCAIAGYDAVLVGEALVRSSDPAAMVAAMSELGSTAVAP